MMGKNPNGKKERIKKAKRIIKEALQEREGKEKEEKEIKKGDDI